VCSEKVGNDTPRDRLSQDQSVKQIAYKERERWKDCTSVERAHARRGARGLHYTRRCASSRPHATDVTLTDMSTRAVLIGGEELSEKDRTPSALSSARMCALAVRASQGRSAVDAEVERVAVTHAREAAE
jgi:hypothetical protein